MCRLWFVPWNLMYTKFDIKRNDKIWVRIKLKFLLGYKVNLYSGDNVKVDQGVSLAFFLIYSISCLKVMMDNNYSLNITLHVFSLPERAVEHIWTLDYLCWEADFSKWWINCQIPSENHNLRLKVKFRHKDLSYCLWLYQEWCN